LLVNLKELEDILSVFTRDLTIV